MTKKGTLYTSYFGKLNKGIGLKVSVARYYPLWLKKTDVNYIFTELSPKKELLVKYKNKKITWEEYTNIYIKQLDIKCFQFKYITALLDKGYDITIYCYEKPNDNCHRHIISYIFKTLGYKSFEIID